MARKTAMKKRVSAAFRELKRKQPKVVAKTKKKKGKEAARKQTIAIALSKAKRKR